MSRAYLDVTLLAITYSFPILHTCYSNANISLKATLETTKYKWTYPIRIGSRVDFTEKHTFKVVLKNINQLGNNGNLIQLVGGGRNLWETKCFLWRICERCSMTLLSRQTLSLCILLDTRFMGSLANNGEIMMSTINQMNYEEVFLSSLTRCWKGFDIFEGDPLKYQIYTYEVVVRQFGWSVAM